MAHANGASVNNHQHTNRLIHESSPYLNQHAHNPVDWYPWSETALKRAVTEDKPIFLSVGYSACHWCHVMERESFQNEDIARFMNAHFINIKVDREERPDLDEIYMTAVHVMNNAGGWPMSVWLTPELEPFYGGTYFPPVDRGGMPGFKRVLETVADLYVQDRERVVSRSNKVVGRIRELAQPSRKRRLPGIRHVDRAVNELLASHDPRYGGFGPAPKFPPAQHLLLLLRSYRRSGDERVLNAVTCTLDNMANGGIHDQLGGGFHRYATDVRWLVPHFEKMLCDNALLAQAYLDAYLVTGTDRYRSVAQGCLDYAMRDMTDRSGGFYSSQDAESEMEEGRCYVWSQMEVRRILEDRDAAIFSEFYGVTPDGNFNSESSILHIPHNSQDVAMRARLTRNELQELLAAGRSKLFEVRSRRIPPQRDDQIITGWNGLMIGALARGGRAFDESRYVEASANAAEFIRSNLYTSGRLCRLWKDGEARLNGYLEDYAFLANGLVDLYEATFDPRWLRWSLELADGIVEHFGDPKTGVLYLTSHDHERLVARTRDNHDGAVPSGASASVMVFLRLARLTGRTEFESRALAVLRSYSEPIDRMPTAFLSMMSALDFHLARPMEIAVVGRANDANADLLRRLVNGRYLPNAVIAGKIQVNGRVFKKVKAPEVPFLDGKGLVRGKPTVYVCENHTCSSPVTSPEQLVSALEA